MKSEITKRIGHPLYKDAEQLLAISNMDEYKRLSSEIRGALIDYYRKSELWSAAMKRLHELEGQRRALTSLDKIPADGGSE